MATYLVTGGAGFIGSNIADHLVEQGHTVRVLDNFATGKRENIQPILDRITLIEGDLADAATCAEAVEGAEYVLHLGALPSVPRSVENPRESNCANTDGTLNILLAARDAGVKRVVFAASSAAYGNQPVSPKVETMAPDPLSPYAATKLAGEHYCAVFSEVYGLEAVSLRYFNVFGPRQDPKSQYAAAIPIFITTMLKGEQPTIFDDGEQSRDFTHIANVIDANVLAATAEGASGETINVACGQSVTLNETIEILNRVLGTNIEPKYAPPRPGDVKHSKADISKAREILGYEPKVGFEEGLQQTVEWYRQRR